MRFIVKAPDWKVKRRGMDRMLALLDLAWFLWQALWRATIIMLLGIAVLWWYDALGLAVYLIPAALALGAILAFISERERARRFQNKMKWESDFAVWLGRVDAILVQYGYGHLERSEEDWVIDFESGFSPDKAAKNFLARK